MSNRGWIVEYVGSSAFEKLATGLAGSQLHSVLLEVMQRRARTRSPTDVLAQYGRDAYCSPAPIDLRASLAVDNHLLTAAEEFEAIELSPVAPLGACSTVAITDQNRVLSALRMTEVAADPTNVLALECALRMRACQATPVHLATSQRVVRAQPVPKRPGYSQHFRVFVLASGGRESKDHAFTVDAVVRHVRTMLGALERLERYGYSFGNRRVDVLATSERKEVGDRVAESLGDLATRKPLEHPYYWEDCAIRSGSPHQAALSFPSSMAVCSIGWPSLLPIGAPSTLRPALAPSLLRCVSAGNDVRGNQAFARCLVLPQIFTMPSTGHSRTMLQKVRPSRGFCAEPIRVA